MEILSNNRRCSRLLETGGPMEAGDAVSIKLNILT
jgi:hypothetical protein